LILTDPPPSQLEFLKVEEVAAVLKIKEKTVREWIGRGELEAYKIGKEWRVRRDHLEEAASVVSRRRPEGSGTRQLPRTPSVGGPGLNAWCPQAKARLNFSIAAMRSGSSGSIAALVCSSGSVPSQMAQLAISSPSRDR
jgi:excisionase family DNA binding protein